MPGPFRPVLTWGLVLFLAACGATPPKVKSAANELSNAERALSAAARQESAGELDLAMADCRRALEAIMDGKAFAGGTELTRLNSLEQEARSRLNSLEIKKVTQKRPPAAAPRTGMTEYVDPVELARRARAQTEADKAERVRAAEEEKRRLLELASQRQPRQQKENDEEPEVTGVPGREDVEPGEAGAEAQAPIGPFPPVHENSPPVNVVRMVQRGKYAIGYVQIYNPEQQGRRVMGVVAFFKDADNQTIARTELAYDYTNFSAENANPTAQGANVAAITMGSHGITGYDSLRIAIPIEHERAAAFKKLSVSVALHTGERLIGDGPITLEAQSVSGGAAAPANPARNAPVLRR